MSGFRDMVTADIRGVFLNTDEFAEKRSVRYDGETYSDIAVVLSGPTQEARGKTVSGSQSPSDHVRGLHSVSAVLYCAAEDLGGKQPKQGTGIEITTREGGRFFQKYYVVASSNEMGMLCVELEALAQ